MHLTQGNADATFQLMSYANPAQYLRYCAGYYIYIYIPLNNFVGSSFSMASLVSQGTLSLPVPHSLRQASTFRTLPITFPFSWPFLFWVCMIPLAFFGLFLCWVCFIAFAFSWPFLFRVCMIPLAFSWPFLFWVCMISLAFSCLFLFRVCLVGCPCRF